MEIAKRKQSDQIHSPMASGQNFMKIDSRNDIANKESESKKLNSLKKILIRQNFTKYFSIPYQIIITIFTIYTLFADDLRTVAFNAQDDLAFDGVNIALICIFSIEIILSSIVLPNYFGNFFFILDIISTLSILFDVNIFTDLIYASSFSNYTFSQVAAQSKASRAAIRAVRIVKLTRIIRIVKLYKAALKASQINQNRRRQLLSKQKQRQKSNEHLINQENSLHPVNYIEHPEQSPKCDNRIHPESPIFRSSPSKFTKTYIFSRNTPQLEKKESQSSGINILDSDFLDEVDKNQSKIRKIMGDTTLKKVIIVVLLLMFVIPLFDTDFYLESADSLDYTINSMNNMLYANTTVDLANIISLINQVLDDHKDQLNYLIYFSTPFNQLPLFKHESFYDFRISDFVSTSIDINAAALMTARSGLTLRSNFADNLEKKQFIGMLNNKEYNSQQSYLNMGKTFFICLMLIGILHFFTSDIQDLIVHPIQKMMQKLKAMAEDPESAAKEEIDLNSQYETTIISNAIIKIGALLSIVFGSAGAEIIGKNIMQQGDMNPMLEGKKKCAIFGFCDIRKFTEINQILEEDILQFVNKISSIVHKAVFRYGGSANKNIGEAFLLVWKIPQSDYTINNENNQITYHNRQYLSILADYSVYSFIKTLVKINKLPEILDYRNDYRLLQKIPDYKVEMGFGLHIGWAIEGAIGSEYKIDASYLSPNVNMASRLQAATKQFGVNLLISESLYDILTPGLQEFCRNIDRVTVKGSNKPLKLYTVDMNLDNISPPADKIMKYPNIPDYQPDIQLKREINLQFLQPQQIENYSAETFIRSKKQFRQVLIDAIPIDFKKRFDEGLKCYLDGKWSDAKLHFKQAIKYHSNDGPTKRLLNYMKNYDFVAPDSWNNYRELTSK